MRPPVSESDTAIKSGFGKGTAKRGVKKAFTVKRQTAAYGAHKALLPRSPETTTNSAILRVMDVDRVPIELLHKLFLSQLVKW